jgi:hypothetical protein
MLSGLLVLAALAQAAEQPLPGTSLTIQNPNGDPLRRKIVVQSKTPAGSAMALPGDPAADGATLHLETTGAVAVTQDFPLPAAGWSTLPGARFKYGNRLVGGPVKTVQLQRSASGVVRLKVLIRGKDGPLAIVPPNPGDAASVVLTVAGGDTYCMTFGGPAGGVEPRDDAKAWQIRGSLATACPAPPPATVELNLLYVHGLKSCTAARQNAEGSLADLESAVNAALPARIAAWEAAHPGVQVVTHSARANLYTATPSGIHPSDSPDPLNMDDWEAGDPGCSATQQGEPCTTAYEWRYRLAQEVNRLFPAPARNVVLIGHSAGARVSMDVAANLGPGGVGTQDWGVRDRIAGVVTLQGVIDQIGSSKYDVVGIASFETSCKDGDAIVGFGDSCAPGNGFCEWVARVDSSPAADWVASNQRALMLTSWGSCSPSAWTDRSDGVLPYDAQASPLAVGLDMTPAPGQTWREAHGQRYGAFCHSDITNASSANHAAARDAARDRILDWIFTAAPRVAATGTNSTTSLSFGQSTGDFPMGSSCPLGDVDDTLTQGTKGAGIDLVGVCRHPGFFDGDDHPISASEFTVTNGAACNGTYRWTQAHDSSNPHAASFWWKTRSVSAAGPDLLATLPPD